MIKLNSNKERKFLTENKLIYQIRVALSYNFAFAYNLYAVCRGGSFFRKMKAYILCDFGLPTRSR
jgi:hypothetical protein